MKPASRKQAGTTRSSNSPDNPSVSSGRPPSPPESIVRIRGHTFIQPNSAVARAVVAGTSMSSEHENAATHRPAGSARPVSNLSVLMSQQGGQRQSSSPRVIPITGRDQSSSATANSSNESSPSAVDEADSASGPPLSFGTLASSTDQPPPPPPPPPAAYLLEHQVTSGSVSSKSPGRVRKCLSSKELGQLAPPSGSPYLYMLDKKEALELAMRKRLQSLRESHPERKNLSRSSSGNSVRRDITNKTRNERRALHNKAVVDDLCEVVTDLFIAEYKLVDPDSYGLPGSATPLTPNLLDRQRILTTVRKFVSSLPLRYALGVDTPSVVLLHMRLMAAVRSDNSKAVLHIHNLEDDSVWGKKESLRLVTLSCHDCTGLLEYISRLLATGGSRVLDADVMLSTDGIVLDRFVVEMVGRLRLDRLVGMIEAFLRGVLDSSVSSSTCDSQKPRSSSVGSKSHGGSSIAGSGPLYYRAENSEKSLQYEREMETAVPLSEVLLASSNHEVPPGIAFPQMRKLHSMPNAARQGDVPKVRLHMRRQSGEPFHPPIEENESGNQGGKEPLSMREQRPLVDRRGYHDLDRVGEEHHVTQGVLDYMEVPSANSVGGVDSDRRRYVPLIPFDELMLIETLGTGRVSTIYRAAWKNSEQDGRASSVGNVHMVALKVAMIKPSGDTSNVDELRREADIAARLEHPSICRLVGVAADPECFCLAYEYCEGGSLLSLLSDSSRYYEYLPIALDIANGMAYLHSRQIVHRDLKPGNILLTRDQRAIISDFGMSVKHYGQELTAETGTYRYMAPEVIRHESYSSNADVYSFGLCLWQLITREVPFATMTPIQAAYAVAEGRRPDIPPSTPRRLREIMRACWDQDSYKRPSFTYIAMALADYAKQAFSPANVGTQTLQIANEMLATVEGNSTVNVDFTTPMFLIQRAAPSSNSYFEDSNDNVGLEIE